MTGKSSLEWLEEGYAHYRAERWEAAGLALERGLSGARDRSIAWYRLGNVRQEQGRHREALDCFERSVALAPDHAPSWNNLGATLQALARPLDAARAFRTAMQLDPDLALPYFNLGRLHEAQGEAAAAADLYRQALVRYPDNAAFRHLLSAATGVTTRRAPPEYVVSLFDGMASRFEQHVVGQLDYHVPEALARRVRPVLSPSCKVLDLGCGTGLVGKALAGNGARLCGIDLSPRMLDYARQAGVYTELACMDIVEALGGAAPSSCRAILAADTFIYIGELTEVFNGAARALEPGGVFAFSVESADQADYRLTLSGRYAHSTAYLHRLAAERGLSERELSRTRIRRQMDGHVQGLIAVFARPE
ncbi:MAG: tetratricopeptide repeat protein [Burkholderiales bacterium]